MADQIYYGFIQVNHGADHVFIYTKEQILEEFERYKINPAVLPEGDDISELDGFPIGGSNSAPSRIWELYGDEAAKAFICGEADGPDYEDPSLVGLAEYYFALDTNEGCMKELLDKFGIDKEAQEKKAMKAIEDDTAMVCNTLGISFNDFYEDEYAYVRVSEVYFLSKIKELIRSAEEKGELVWSDNTDEPEIHLKLDEDTAKEILRHNSFDVWGKDKNMIDETYLVIEKEPDGEIVYDFIEYAGGNSLDIPCDESEELMEAMIQKFVEDAVGEKEDREL